MPHLVRVKFVNNSGNLSPKTYEYKTVIPIPNGVYSQYFNIETADGNNYRNSKVVITDVCPITVQEFNENSSKQIAIFRQVGTPISEKHLREMGRKSVIVPKEQCDAKITFGDPLTSSKCTFNLNQCNYLTTSNPYSTGKWFEKIGSAALENTITFDDLARAVTIADDWKKEKEVREKTTNIVEDIQKISNTLSKIHEKENKPMFENIMSKFEFGRVTNTNVKMSMSGIAFKDKDRGWIAFDNEGGAIDVTGLVFDLPLMYCMPVAVKDVQIGDYIRHNDCWVKVMDENERGNLVCLNPWNHEEAVVVPVKSPFGFDFVTKLMCLGEDMFKGSDASAQSPFGSMLPLMLMMNEGSNSDSMLPLMLMMQNNGGALDMSNPFMLMALMGDKNGSKNDLMLPLMYSMMAKKEHKCDGHCKNCGN